MEVSFVLKYNNHIIAVFFWIYCGKNEFGLK
ncbi:hypothetical protein MNBD_NITROSPIRAE03-964 [hydrothermal vent metagenome]|uniref:Uncharacterized protein n=1 Tax=hydrothermal vent metagenome TaxID=652676 RepID=A0A3B1DEU5_9ZZZZ